MPTDDDVPHSEDGHCVLDTRRNTHSGCLVVDGHDVAWRTLDKDLPRFGARQQGRLNPRITARQKQGIRRLVLRQALVELPPLREDLSSESSHSFADSFYAALLAQETRRGPRDWAAAGDLAPAGPVAHGVSHCRSRSSSTVPAGGRVDRRGIGAPSLPRPVDYRPGGRRGSCRPIFRLWPGRDGKPP